MTDNEVQQPIIPEAVVFVDEYESRRLKDPRYTRTEFGHAAGTLVSILNAHRFHETPEEAAEHQRASLISKAQELLDTYGPEIIQHLTQELKLVIEEEQLIKNR